jgi:hypothetical protein
MSARPHLNEHENERWRTCSYGERDDPNPNRVHW